MRALTYLSLSPKGHGNEHKSYHDVYSSSDTDREAKRRNRQGNARFGGYHAKLKWYKSVYYYTQGCMDISQCC